MSGFIVFSKTVILPAVTALVLYLLLFHVLVPLYIRHRDRYRQYLPLSSTSQLTSRLPQVIHPQTLRSKFSSFFSALTTRLFFSSAHVARRRESASSSAASLFDAESGEAMVGFDVQERESEAEQLADRQRQRQRQDEQNANMENARRTVSGQTVRAPLRFPAGYDEHDPTSDRRLSRELEEGFRDDSESEGEDGDVTIGRRSISVVR